MKLTLSKPLLGALLAVTLTGGAALAAKAQGETWCRVEPSWKSSFSQKLDLQSLMRPAEPVRHRVAVRRPVAPVAKVAQVRPAVVAARVRPRPAPAPATWSEPARNVELASCSSGHASILCPGYQLIGFEY